MKSVIAAFRGVSLVRLPFDIMQASALLTIVALAEAGVIRLPVMTPDGRITAVPLNTGEGKPVEGDAIEAKPAFGFAASPGVESDTPPA